MTSTTIYPQKQYCVYLTTYHGSKLPMFYIGSTTISNVKSGYHGSVSSKMYRTIYESELKNNPKAFKTIIISRYHSRKMATYRERKLQKQLNVVKSSMYFNMSIASPKGFAGMNTAGKNNPRYKILHTDDVKKLLSEMFIGTFIAKDAITNKLIGRISVNDDRYINGSVVGITKGIKNPSSRENLKDQIIVKDDTGKTFKISVNDDRYISGELVHHTKNMKSVIHKITGKKIRITLDQYDPDIHQNPTTNNIHVKDKNDNHFLISRNDPRYLSGELVPFSSKRVTVKDIQGNKFNISTDDPRYLSGELVHHTTGTANAYSPEGKSLGRIDMKDSRWLTGEIQRSAKPRMIRQEI